MAFDGRAVANHLLDLADEMGLRLTHMSVHKVMFFAHGWRLAARREPLIRQPFEAWEYGPVVRSVYDALKPAGGTAITNRAYGYDPVERTPFLIRGDFPPEDGDFLRAILGAYGRFSATALSDITHRKGGAWDRVWNAPAGKVTLGMHIADDDIRDDFIAGRMDFPNMAARPI